MSSRSITESDTVGESGPLDSGFLTRFFQALQARSVSPKTFNTYAQALQSAQTVGEQRKRPLPSWTSTDLEIALAQWHRDGLHPRSLALRLSALRSFFRWAVREKLRGDNPAVGLKAPRAPKRLPDTFSAENLDGLLAHIPEDGWDLRDKAILELFYSSGLRLAELAQLNVDDLPREDGLLRVQGKGSKQREVPIGSKAREVLSKWLAVRATLPGAVETALFLSNRGSRLSMRSIQQRMEHWGKKLGLDQRLHPHALRHSCASHFLQGSQDLRAVQDLLGHAQLGTTQIYTHLDFQHLTRVYDQAHPRARKK